MNQALYNDLFDGINTMDDLERIINDAAAQMGFDSPAPVAASDDKPVLDRLQALASDLRPASDLDAALIGFLAGSPSWLPDNLRNVEALRSILS